MSLLRKNTSVPEVHKIALSWIRDATEESLINLMGAIDEVDYVLNIKSLASKISENSPNLDTGSITSVLNTLMHFYSYINSRQTTDNGITGYKDLLDKLVENLCNMMKNSDEEKLHLPSEQYMVFRDKLAKLLSINKLRYIAKATVLMREAENIFSNAHVISDIRSIFGDDPEHKLIGAGIIHTLKISCLSDGEQKDFFVTLDDSDVTYLLKILEQTREQTKNLIPVLEKASLPRIIVE